MTTKKYTKRTVKTPVKKCATTSKQSKIGKQACKPKTKKLPKRTSSSITKIPDTTQYTLKTEKVQTVEVGRRTYRIPINKNGRVEKDVMMARLVFWKKDGRRRNPHADIRKENLVILDPSANRPQDIAAWWADPGCCDIEGIDTPGAKKAYNLDGVSFDSKAMVKVQKKIAIIGGTKEDRVRIRKTLNDDFSAAELGRLTKHRDIIVTVGDTGSPNRGGYYRSRKSDIYLEDIGLRPGSDEDTIVHEFTHALRATDKTRTGMAKTPRDVDEYGFLKRIPDDEEWARDSVVEEAATVAEANTRSKKPCTPSGYYSYLEGGEGKEYENYRADRVTLLGKKKGDTASSVVAKKGPAAVKTVNDRFHKTEISKLKHIPKE